MTIIQVISKKNDGQTLFWTNRVAAKLYYNIDEQKNNKITRTYNIILEDNDGDIKSKYCLQIPLHSESDNFTVSFPVKILFQTVKQAEKFRKFLSSHSIEAVMIGPIVDAAVSGWVVDSSKPDHQNQLVSLRLNSFKVRTQILHLFSALDKIQPLPYGVKSYICRVFFAFNLEVDYKQKLKEIILDGLITNEKLSRIKDQNFLEAFRTASSSGGVGLFIFLADECERLNLIHEATLFRIEVLARIEQNEGTGLITDKQYNFLSFKIAEALYGGGCSLHSEDVSYMMKEGIAPDETGQSEESDEETKQTVESLNIIEKKKETKKDSAEPLDIDEQPARKKCQLRLDVENFSDNKRLRFILKFFKETPPLEEAIALRKRIFLQLAGYHSVSATLKSTDLCDIAEFFVEQKEKLQDLELDKKAQNESVALVMATSAPSASSAPLAVPIINAFTLSTSDSNSTKISTVLGEDSSLRASCSQER